MRLNNWLALVLVLGVQPQASSLGASSAAAEDAQWADVSSYPRLVLIAGSATYSAPDLSLNYFFYDGSYWVYHGDEWYRSGWYDGPWAKVSPLVVPLSVLQIPVAYYNRPRSYFSGWRADAPPRWDLHWGSAWARYRGVWDRPDRGAVAVPAPRPDYQRLYGGASYPDSAQQATLRAHYYPYRPHEPLADSPVKSSALTSAAALLPGLPSPIAASALTPH
jgi:hypothetical protein